ncbi:HNH endonuclease [Phaeodactylibacter xiamenensis]|uniref:HNH endonuclease n=1 Tax=Phaeodactylibacter xiamenensis TaxID=1524460 RepID=UPI003BAD725F
MSRYVNRKTRDAVAKRARSRCEYCLLHEGDAYLAFEIDHIISLKHGGNSELDNLAYSCVACNRMKGADIGSIVLPEKEFIRLYNPRTDSWEEHFRIMGPRIVPISDIGKVTTKILLLNDDLRISEREALISVGRYPPQLL